MPNFLGLYPMAPGTDYAQQTVGVNAIDDETITELTRIVCYDQPIYNDMCLEEDEWLGLTLGIDRSSVLTTVRPFYDQAVILIQDNDSRLHNNMYFATLEYQVYAHIKAICMIGEWSKPT